MKMCSTMFFQETTGVIFLIVIVTGYVLLPLLSAYARNIDFSFALKYLCNDSYIRLIEASKSK